MRRKAALEIEKQLFSVCHGEDEEDHGFVLDLLREKLHPADIWYRL